MIASQPATEGGHLKLKGIRNQVADGDKIAREGERGQGCDPYPENVFADASRQTPGAHRSVIQSCSDAGASLGHILDTDEQPGPDALRAGKSTPDPAPGHRHEEQQAGSGNHQARHQREVVPGEGVTEQDQFALGERKHQPGLTINLYPHQAEEQRQQRPAGQPTQVLKSPLRQTHMKLAVSGKGRCVLFSNGYFFHCDSSPDF